MHKTRVEVTKDEMKSARRALKIVRELQTILGTDDYLDDIEGSLGKLILENSHKRDLEEEHNGFRSSGFGSKKPFEGGSTGFGSNKSSGFGSSKSTFGTKNGFGNKQSSGFSKPKESNRNPKGFSKDDIEEAEIIYPTSTKTEVMDHTELNEFVINKIIIALSLLDDMFVLHGLEPGYHERSKFSVPDEDVEELFSVTHIIIDNVVGFDSKELELCVGNIKRNMIIDKGSMTADTVELMRRLNKELKNTLKHVGGNKDEKYIEYVE
jgi:hypothetical protein